MIQGILAAFIALHMAITPMVNNQPLLDACRINNTTVNIYAVKQNIKPAFIKITRELHNRSTILYHEYETSIWSYKIRDRHTNSQLAKYRIEITWIGVARPTVMTVKAQRDCFVLYK